ncbi:MAG TPA: hypothetical protein VGM54_24540 [Chthoniobacter sp.]|jgi:hypothetical protein
MKSLALTCLESQTGIQHRKRCLSTGAGRLLRRQFKSIACATFFTLCAGGWSSARAEGPNLEAIKTYLVGQVTKLDAAAHDYEANAAAYQKIVDASGGNYDKAAISNGTELMALIRKMQGDYLNLHMNGYETIEGIAAGVRELVQFDIYFDSGVPKNQGATDNPVAPVTLREPSGKTIVDRDGNLYHYVIEPCLYGTKAVFVRKLGPEASQALHGIKFLPLATVTSASAKDAAREADIFLAACKAWQLKLNECIGALVWMTPTFNTYFNDLRDSIYGPNPSAYISETRVKDMRGIMGSLRLTYGALNPALAAKDPALARQLKDEYDAIMAYIDQSDARDQRARAAKSRLSRVELEEMGSHAKTMSDQLGPQIKQAAAIMGVQIPRKPYL